MSESIDNFNYQLLKEEITNITEDEALIAARLAHLQSAFALPRPGAPDEAWRRVPLDSFVIESYALEAPTINVLTDMPALKADGIYIDSGRDKRDDNKRVSDFVIRFNHALSVRKEKEMPRANDVTQNKYLSFNEALSRHSVYIHVPEDVRAQDLIVIEISNSHKNALVLPQIYICLEANAEASVMVEFKSEHVQNAASISVTKALVGANARLRLLNYQYCDAEATHFHHEHSILSENAHLERGAIHTGSKIGMSENAYTLAGEGASLNYLGLAHSTGAQFAGEKVSVEHHAKHTKSMLYTKNILYDTAENVFVGNIQMPRGARGAEGREESKTLLLSDAAVSCSIPQLEIVENDVSCSHAASMSAPSEEELFLLMARGIPRNTARDLLVNVFYKDVLNRLHIVAKDAHIKQYLYDSLFENIGIRFENEEENEFAD